MHEMSVALAVIDQVETAVAQTAQTGAVHTVRLRIGELAGVVPDSLTFCFELACAKTLLEGARLVTETVPGRARCAPCAHEWPVGMPPRLTCPACRGADVELLSGRELQIAEVHWTGPGPAAAALREPIPEES